MATRELPIPVVCTRIRGTQLNHQPRLSRHAEHAMALFMRGSGHYRLGPSLLPADRPVYIFLPRGHDDENGFVGEVDAWSAAVRWRDLRIARPGAHAMTVRLYGGSLILPRYKVIAAPLAAQVSERFGALRAALARQDAIGAVRASALALDLFALYADAPEVGAGAQATHRALERFRAALEARACEPVTIERLAREAGLGADHLRDLFRARYGIRPVEYRAELRLARARALLTESALSVSAAARVAGYADPLYFSRVFRARFGMSPSALIRRAGLVGAQGR